MRSPENRTKPRRRRRRDAGRRRLRRRQRFIERAITNVAPESYLPQQALALLLGPLADAKRAYRQAKRREAVNSLGTQLAVPPSIGNHSTPLMLPRPHRVLSQLNRSTIFPPLLPDKIDIEPVSVGEILTTLRRSFGHSSPHHLLDALATASGIPWENCAEILLGNKLLTAPVEPEQLEAIRGARTFWDKYEQGRARYSALVEREHTAQFEGDWAYFDSDQLATLLPGMIIPARLKRADYLANYVKERDYFSLDLHAGSNAAPLFQHRFLPRFNPLSFGRPHLGSNEVKGRRN